MELLTFHGIPWNFSTGYSDSMEFHEIWLCSQILWNFLNSMECHGTFVLGLAIPWNSMEFGVGIKFHRNFKVPWNSMELPFWHGKVPWNSMELWNIDINKFQNWGNVFHCLLYYFMSLYIKQSISSWNIEIFQFQSNSLVPPILLKWRYIILNGGLLYIYIYIYIYIHRHRSMKEMQPNLIFVNNCLL